MAKQKAFGSHADPAKALRDLKLSLEVSLSDFVGWSGFLDCVHTVCLHLIFNQMTQT